MPVSRGQIGTWQETAPYGPDRCALRTVDLMVDQPDALWVTVGDENPNHLSVIWREPEGYTEFGS